MDGSSVGWGGGFGSVWLVAFWVVGDVDGSGCGVVDLFSCSDADVLQMVEVAGGRGSLSHPAKE